MIIRVKRIAKRSSYTIGNLYIDGIKFCDTLEDAVRVQKIAGMTAIPAGIYEVIVTMSKRFKKRLPELLNVPNFSGVRIHTGNTDKDTEGCILVGTNNAVGRVNNSREAFGPLMEKIEAACKKEGCVIIIE